MRKNYIQIPRKRLSTVIGDLWPLDRGSVAVILDGEPGGSKGDVGVGVRIRVQHRMKLQHGVVGEEDQQYRVRTVECQNGVNC